MNKLYAIGFLALLLLSQGCTKKQVRYLPILGISTVDATTKDTLYHTITSFKATDQTGKIITRDTFAHKVYVANFFFVTCPGICKQMNNQLERVQKAFAGNAQVKFVSFTVNPEQDTTEALAGYAKLHDAVPYQWYFLRDDKDSVLKLARQSFLAETNGYLLHSQNLTLVDMQGRIRGIYSGIAEQEVDKLIADINLLLKEEQLNNNR